MSERTLPQQSSAGTGVPDSSDNWCVVAALIKDSSFVTFTANFSHVSFRTQNIMYTCYTQAHRWNEYSINKALRLKTCAAWQDLWCLVHRPVLTLIWIPVMSSYIGLLHSEASQPCLLLKAGRLCRCFPVYPESWFRILLEPLPWQLSTFTATSINNVTRFSTKRFFSLFP